MEKKYYNMRKKRLIMIIRKHFHLESGFFIEVSYLSGPGEML